MQEALDEIDEVRTVAVMPGSVELLSTLRDKLGLTVPLLSDPDWDLHRRYGMQRGSRREIYLSLSTWKAYARLARHWSLKRPSEDIFQLGGTAVVNGGGVLRWLHRSRNPADYAEPGDVVEAVAALDASPAE